MLTMYVLGALFLVLFVLPCMTGGERRPTR
jgi:hypothetical protein